MIYFAGFARNRNNITSEVEMLKIFLVVEEKFYVVKFSDGKFCCCAALATNPSSKIKFMQ
jgi:hypothetical protein